MTEPNTQKHAFVHGIATHSICYTTCVLWLPNGTMRNLAVKRLDIAVVRL